MGDVRAQEVARQIDQLRADDAVMTTASAPSVGATGVTSGAGLGETRSDSSMTSTDRPAAMAAQAASLGASEAIAGAPRSSGALSEARSDELAWQNDRQRADDGAPSATGENRPAETAYDAGDSRSPEARAAATPPPGDAARLDAREATTSETFAGRSEARPQPFEPAAPATQETPVANGRSASAEPSANGGNRERFIPDGAPNAAADADTRRAGDAPDAAPYPSATAADLRTDAPSVARPNGRGDVANGSPAGNHRRPGNAHGTARDRRSDRYILRTVGVIVRRGERS